MLRKSIENKESLVRILSVFVFVAVLGLIALSTGVFQGKTQKTWWEEASTTYQPTSSVLLSGINPGAYSRAVEMYKYNFDEFDGGTTYSLDTEKYDPNMNNNAAEVFGLLPSVAINNDVPELYVSSFYIGREWMFHSAFSLKAIDSATSFNRNILLGDRSDRVDGSLVNELAINKLTGDEALRFCDNVFHGEKLSVRFESGRQSNLQSKTIDVRDEQASIIKLGCALWVGLWEARAK